jgi:endonuclease/exonuclease/phosphatase family metal-dependent hydrolase
MQISILQWNAWYDEDINNVVRFLKEHPADIICLQELVIHKNKNSPKYIANQLGYNFYDYALPISSTDGEKIMLANGIFSRFPITTKRFVLTEESSGVGGYNDESRSYIEVTLDISGKEMTVATTHMSYTHKFEATESKNLETKKLLKEVSNHKESYIFAGDLNALPDSPTVQAISSLLQNAGPDTSVNTWATKPFSYNNFEASTLDWRLDYIFTTKDIAILSSKIIKTDYSDHLPVFALIDIA